MPRLGGMSTDPGTPAPGAQYASGIPAPGASTPGAQYASGISPRPDACSSLSRALGEPIAGTAPTTTGYVLLEHGGPWGRKILADAQVSDPDGEPFDLGGLAVAELEPLGVTTLLMRRHGSGRGIPSPATVVVASLSPDGGRAASRTVSRASELASLHLPRVLAELRGGVVPEGWEPLTEGYFVCTHGQRDVCCAELGRPVAAAFEEAAGRAPVWEVSHLGGHRLAPNMMLLPDGLHLGRVTAADAAEVVAEFRAGRIGTARLRGRSALAPSVQAAEIAVREAAGVNGLDSVRLVAVQAGALSSENVPPDHGPLTVSTWRVGAELWHCSVLTAAQGGDPVPESCGAAPVPQHPRQQVRAIQKLG